VGDNGCTVATNVAHHPRYGCGQLGERVEIEVRESGLAWSLQVGEIALLVYGEAARAPPRSAGW
jgi:hypothetical protein